MRATARYASVAVVAVIAALIAVYAARLLLPAADTAPGLHEVLHGEIKLSSEQDARIARLERQFADDRRDLDRRLQDANAAIADAYASEHAYGPKVVSAIDRSHVVMGELQKLTLRHVLAMRAVLTPQQATIFDREVGKALTASTAR